MDILFTTLLGFGTLLGIAGALLLALGGVASALLDADRLETPS